MAITPLGYEETGMWVRVGEQNLTGGADSQPTSLNASQPRLTYKRTGSRNSVNTPGFFAFGPGRRLPANPFTFALEKATYLQGSRYRYTPDLKPNQYGYHKSLQTGALLASLGYTSLRADKTVPSDLDAQCRNELLAEVKKMKINLAQLFAERQKTANTVGDAAMKLVTAFGRLRRGDFKGAASAMGVPPARRGQSRFSRDYAKRGAKALGGGWLSLQYGWKPILNDVHGAAEHLATLGLQPVYVTTRKSKKRITPGDSFTYTKQESLETRKLIEGSRVTVVKYGVTYHKSPNPNQTLKEVGITNPALLAWELLPYSFVVDWFLPIGSWISTFDATLGLEFHSGYKTLFSKVATTYTESASGRYGSYIDENHGTAAFEEVYCQRTKLTSFPLPALPRFKDPTSLSHMVTSLALLTKTFKR